MVPCTLLNNWFNNWAAGNQAECTPVEDTASAVAATVAEGIPYEILVAAAVGNPSAAAHTSPVAVRTCPAAFLAAAHTLPAVALDAEERRSS